MGLVPAEGSLVQRIGSVTNGGIQHPEFGLRRRPLPGTRVNTDQGGSPSSPRSIVHPGHQTPRGKRAPALSEPVAACFSGIRLASRPRGGPCSADDLAGDVNHQQAPSRPNTRAANPTNPECCLLAVAVEGGGDDLGAGLGDDHVVLVVGAAEARRLDAPLNGKAHARSDHSGGG